CPTAGGVNVVNVVDPEPVTRLLSPFAARFIWVAVNSTREKEIVASFFVTTVLTGYADSSTVMSSVSTLSLNSVPSSVGPRATHRPPHAAVLKMLEATVMDGSEVPRGA